MEDSKLPAADEFSSPPPLQLLVDHEVASAGAYGIGGDCGTTSARPDVDDAVQRLSSLETLPEERDVAAAGVSTGSSSDPVAKHDDEVEDSALVGAFPPIKYDENFGPEHHREVFYSLFGPIYEQLKATGHPILRSEEYNEIASFLVDYENGVSAANLASSRWRKRYKVSTKRKEQDPINLNDANDNILMRLDRRVVMYDKIFDVIKLVHDQLGHPRDARRQKVAIDATYYGVSEKLVKIFIDTCPLCLSSRGADKKVRARESIAAPSSVKKRSVKIEPQDQEDFTHPTRAYRKQSYEVKDKVRNNGNAVKSRHRTAITRATNSRWATKSPSSRATTSLAERRVVQELLAKLTYDDPLLRLDGAAAAANIATSTTSPMTLERAISPLSLETFVTCLFRQKAVHIKKANNNSMGGDPSLVAAMYNLNVPSILKHTSSKNIFVWVMQQQQQGKHCSSNVIQSIEMDDPDHAFILYKHGGHALYCRAPPEVEQPLVASFLSESGLGCGQYDPKSIRSLCLGRGEVETFISPKNHVTNFHVDFQENFTFQLSGVKKWRLKQGTVKYPLRGCTPHYAESPDAIEGQLKAARLSNPDFTYESPPSNSFGKEEEVIMTAGDVLYFPAGMWHSVETLEEGISINVSLMATNYATLVTNALHHFLLTQDEQWRESVTSTASNNLSVLENLHNLLTVKLPSVVQDFINLAGAESILPPALRYPSSLSGASIEDDEEDSSTGSHDDDGDIVDVENFVGPEGWNCDKPNFDEAGINVVLGKNPLATLISQHDDIFVFCNNQNTVSNNYTSTSGNKKRKVDEAKYFILNVNYGGDDSHESSIRAKFVCHRKEDIDLFQRYVTAEQLGNDPALVHSDSVIINDDGTTSNIATTGITASPPSCLFFYGYFVWLKEEDNNLVFHC